MSYTDQDFEQTAASHTPGPWSLLPVGGNRRLIDPGIGEVYGLGRTPDANARLIAAAPDLLAALKEYTDRHEAACDPRGLPEYDQACAAITKATGREA